MNEVIKFPLKKEERKGRKKVEKSGRWVTGFFLK
jgi:hypothetical protein